MKPVYNEIWMELETFLCFTYVFISRWEYYTLYLHTAWSRDKKLHVRHSVTEKSTFWNPVFLYISFLPSIIFCDKKQAYSTCVLCVHLIQWMKGRHKSIGLWMWKVSHFQITGRYIFISPEIMFCRLICKWDYISRRNNNICARTAEIN
jgi:hypothetical protein